MALFMLINRLNCSAGAATDAEKKLYNQWSESETKKTFAKLIRRLAGLSVEGKLIKKSKHGNMCGCLVLTFMPHKNIMVSVKKFLYMKIRRLRKEHGY